MRVPRGQCGNVIYERYYCNVEIPSVTYCTCKYSINFVFQLSLPDLMRREAGGRKGEKAKAYLLNFNCVYCASI